MKRYFSILFVFGLLAFAMPVASFAQDEISQYVADELKNFQKELDRMGKRIDTARNVEKYETEFKARHQLVESWYSINSEVIFSDKDLQMKYIQYTSTYEQILKTIEDRKAEKAKQEKMQKITTKLNGFLQELTALEESGNRYVSNKRIDSLKLIKDKANDCNSMATMEYGKNQELIDDDGDLSLLWKNIKDANTRIANMEVVKSPIDIKTILMIVGILAGITLMVTMISNKVKSIKMTKVPKVKKEKKKKEEDVPSI